MNATDESSAIETPPRRKKIHQRNNLKEGEEYQQIEVLEKFNLIHIFDQLLKFFNPTELTP
jgi:hypothetical protein